MSKELEEESVTSVFRCIWDIPLDTLEECAITEIHIGYLLPHVRTNTKFWIVITNLFRGKRTIPLSFFQSLKKKIAYTPVACMVRMKHEVEVDKVESIRHLENAFLEISKPATLIESVYHYWLDDRNTAKKLETITEARKLLLEVKGLV
jgi:hypothetical protein